MNTDEKKSSPAKISAREINLPKGGGAMRGTGDTFQANLFNGTGTYSIPIAITPARGFDPQLSLSYSSGSGNSEFGLGFSLALSGITVDTKTRIPAYDESDQYLLDGADLVKKAASASSPNPRTVTESGIEYIVTTFLPRIESSFSIIEQWLEKNSGLSSWKITDAGNGTTFYGRTDLSRIANPENDVQIAQWLIDEAIDAKGNRIAYTYKKENDENVPENLFELNRNAGGNRYIASIEYGNYFDTTNTEQFAFSLLFNYGEYSIADPLIALTPASAWEYRPDPFSTYKYGFEIRTRRRCKNILLVHNLPAELGEAVMVRSTSFSYDHTQQYNTVDVNGLSLITKIEFKGYRKMADGTFEQQSLPPIEFGYSSFHPPQSPTFRTLSLDPGTIPGYLDESSYLPVDLNGDGLPGFLFSNDLVTLYFEPLGEGLYTNPKELVSFPLQKNGQDATVRLVDIDGNSQHQLLVTNKSGSGYYPHNADGSWGNFIPFEQYPTDFANPEMEMADLDADGKTDWILAAPDDLLVYHSLGKTGYAAARTLSNEEHIPLVKTGDLQEKVSFADMFGDGLSHRVRIRNGSVECWPSLGRGRFGRKISFAGAPVFSDEFDASRLFLADIDGSGTTDIAYVYADRVDIFINQSGNSFSEPISITLPELFSPNDRIDFSDILGNGTSCLVFTKIAPVPVHYYYNFIGELKLAGNPETQCQKPYLLNEVTNNMGTVTRIRYASSTKFALEDKKAGRPWVSPLAFPVQVVEESTTFDLISQSRYVSKHKYHEGFYDTVEREFRGFGFVESWDSETYAEFSQNGSNPDYPVSAINRELFVPPVYSKAWYFNGSGGKVYDALLKQYRSSYFSGDAAARPFADNFFDALITNAGAKTIAESCTALAGQVLRSEIYAEDETDSAGIPYAADESSYAVVLIQPATENNFAVFRIDQRESISYHYERNAVDPRVEQHFVLETDPLNGQPLLSCSVFLPRRAHPGLYYPEQQTLQATAATAKYINTEGSYYYRGIPCSEQQFELSGLAPVNSLYFSWNEIKAQVTAALLNKAPYLSAAPAPGIKQATLIGSTKSFYWNEQQTAVLPFGEISSRALLHHEAHAAFTKNNITQFFGDRLSDAVIKDYGGYVFNNSTGYWENCGLVQKYFTAPENFYQPSETVNDFVPSTSSLYVRTTVTWDAYFLAPLSVSSYLDAAESNTVTATMDYQAMQPKQVVDINGNVSQVLFDCFGQVIVQTLFGKENNKNTGGMLIYPYGIFPAQYIPRTTAPDGGSISYDTVLTYPDYFLQGASGYFFYDLNAFATARASGKTKPANAVSLLRENYFLTTGISTFSCQTSVAFFDGLGRTLQQKVKDGTRWLVSGRTVYNNKGKACETYFPFYSTNAGYETQDEIMDLNLAPPPAITHYDPLLRVIRVDSPKGFFSKVEFTPWEEKHFDENDTVLDAPYYIHFIQQYPAQPTPAQADEKDALQKAARFYNTPAISIHDNTGSVIREIQLLENEVKLETLYKRDILGRVIEAVDPRLHKSNTTSGTQYYNFRYSYAMGDEQPLVTDSADAGLQKHFSSVFDKQVWSLSPRDYCQFIAYDRLQRKTELRILKTNPLQPIPAFSTFNLVEKFKYGELVNGVGKNLRGQLYELKDLSGTLTNSSYSMTGQLLQTDRQLVSDYKTPADYNTAVALQRESFTTDFVYNALSQLLNQYTPDGTLSSNTYNRLGQLQTVTVKRNKANAQVIVKSISYDVNGQRTQIVYGNDVTTNYTYEKTTLRLVNLVSRKKDSSLLQNIIYTYDPQGNITRLRDASFATVFNNNQQVDPLSDYTYDALYRLIQANGRQHPGINGNTYKNNVSDGSFLQSLFSQLPDVNDSTKLENYTEKFTYDDSGNLTEKKHIAVSSSFTVNTPVQANSNRLSAITYDAAGNMRQLQINSTVALDYNCCDNLVSAAVIQRPNELNDADYYVYDSEEQRTRKVSERFTNGASVSLIEEKMYIGNYEIKRSTSISPGSGKKPKPVETITEERQSLRIMDGDTCIAILHYWVKAAANSGKTNGSTQLRYQMDNHLGSVSMELDENAALISYEEYYPYGGTAIIAGTNSVEVALKEYRYSGKECDNSSGLYYYGRRYYVSWLSRWLNADPAGTVDGLNLFAFVGGNPVKYEDVGGMMLRLIRTEIIRPASAGAARSYIQVIDGHFHRTRKRPDNQNEDNVQKASASLVTHTTKPNYRFDTTNLFLKVAGTHKALSKNSLNMAHGVSYDEFAKGVIRLVDIAFHARSNEDRDKHLDFLKKYMSDFAEHGAYEYLNRKYKEEITELSNNVRAAVYNKSYSDSMEAIKSILKFLNRTPGNLTGGDATMNYKIQQHRDPASTTDGYLFPPLVGLFRTANRAARHLGFDKKPYGALSNENGTLSSTSKEFTHTIDYRGPRTSYRPNHGNE